MSSAGRVSVEVIERRRREMEMARERKRRKAVKVRIGELCEEIDSEIAILAETGGAAWVHKEIKGTLEIRESAKNVDEADVDNMLRKVTEARARLSSLQQIAGERRQEKKMALDLARSSLEALKMELNEISGHLGMADSKEDMRLLSASVDDRLQAQMNIQSGELEAFLQDTRTSAQEIREADDAKSIQEELRRHIIRSLMGSMTELGFIVGKPKMIRENDRVAVIGTMPSGRTVRFDVDDGGMMEFDMDGYPGRECADHLDQVLLKLEDSFGVETGPIQHNWKNPDRISKGSKSFPTGGASRTMGGRQE